LFLIHAVPWRKIKQTKKKKQKKYVTVMLLCHPRSDKDKATEKATGAGRNG
jgi:hypothetical protein